MLEHATDTVSFFQAMAPILIANVLTVTFVYCFAKIHQKELAQEEEGRLTYLWLIILVFLFMLYGLYTWGVYPLGKA
jgi:heme/copper-type cytochrome/quinol oxidase subunit 2